MLSRNELYAPLVAYQQTDVAPSSFMMKQKSTPPGMKDSSLVSFLQKISQEYHRQEAGSNDPKNNGSRPTSMADVESKIKQRAVAIVGGKATASMTSTSGTSSKRRKRKRKEKSWEDIEEIVKRQSTSISNMPTRLGSICFLRQLNKKWNDYIHLALRLNEDGGNPAAIMSRFGVLRGDLEVAGANVRIGSCCQRKCMENRYGILLGEKKNTWTVAMLRIHKEDKKKSISNFERKDRRTLPFVDVLVLPKQGTTLTLVVPLDIENVKDATNGGNVETDEQIIDLCHWSICIVLGPQRSNK